MEDDHNHICMRAHHHHRNAEIRFQQPTWKHGRKCFGFGLLAVCGILNERQKRIHPPLLQCLLDFRRKRVGEVGDDVIPLYETNKAKEPL